MHLLGTMAGEKTPKNMNFRDEMALILVVNMGTSSHNNERKHATIFENKHLVFFFAMHIGFGFWDPFLFLAVFCVVFEHLGTFFRYSQI